MKPEIYPIEPPWPYLDEKIRIDQSRTRLALLCEDWEEDLSDFLRALWGAERRAAVGIVDTGWNALASYCSQMSRPGLYGQRPAVHCAGDGALVNALLNSALWASKGQRVEFLTRGLGDLFLRPHVDAAGRASLRLVYPHRVYVEVDVDRPDRAAYLRELRLRRSRATGWIWTWDTYDLRDPERPVFRIDRADGASAEDWARTFIADWDGEYPWRYADGQPFIPYVHYYSEPTGEYWAWSVNRGLHRATFHAARLNNTTLYGADSAAMPIVACVNGEPRNGVVVESAEAGGEVSSLRVMPGSWVPVAPLDPDKNTSLQIISGSADVLNLFQVQRAYTLSVLAQRGLRGEDVTRNEGNPTSAAALSISDSSRREEQRRLGPLFAESDRELCCQLAAMARLQGLGEASPERPEDWLIEYKTIPPSEGEQTAQREDLSYQREQGLISEVDVFLALHPGLTREFAVAAIKAARAEQADLATPGQAPLAPEQARGLLDIATAVAERRLNPQQARELLRLVAPSLSDESVVALATPPINQNPVGV